MASQPRHAAATPAAPRALRALVALLVTLMSVVAFASPAAAVDGPNHGTVKIDSPQLADDGPNNNPKPGCTFAIDFYNFPSDTPTATISFASKSPKADDGGPFTTVSESDIIGDRTVEFATVDSPANVLEFRTAPFTVNPDGNLVSTPNDHILLKVTVTLVGDRDFQKHKVFKLQCLPVTPPPLPDLVPDLALTKGGSDTVTAGSPGSYTLAVQNVGTAAVADPIVVSDTLPAHVTPTAASGDDFDCTVVGQTVTCTRQNDLAAGASTAVITITATFGAGAVPSVINTARVTPVTDETVLSNNTDTHPTTVTVVPPQPRFDLAVDKSGPATAASGTSISYTIAVRNLGPDASPGFTVTDQLSAGQTATAASGTGYVCGISANGRTVTCTHAAGLPGGQSAGAITVTVTVLAAGPGAISDTASVPVLTGDTNGGNNSDTVTTTVPGSGNNPGGGTDPVIVDNPVIVDKPGGGGTPVLDTPVVVDKPVVVGPPTGLPPANPPGGGVLPIRDRTPDQPATLPQAPPVPQVPVPAAPLQPIATPAAAPVTGSTGAVAPRALPFTGVDVHELLMAGMALLLLGAFTVGLSRTPRAATA